MTALTRIQKFKPRKEHTLAASLDFKLFGEAVRTRREELRIPRGTLAEKVGISYGQMSKIELGENGATLAVYEALCRELKVGRVPLL
jgi:DNA-binding XRE family transcriptional regulator